MMDGVIPFEICFYSYLLALRVWTMFSHFGNRTLCDWLRHLTHSKL